MALQSTDVDVWRRYYRYIPWSRRGRARRVFVLHCIRRWRRPHFLAIPTAKLMSDFGRLFGGEVGEVA